MKEYVEKQGQDTTTVTLQENTINNNHNIKGELLA